MEHPFRKKWGQNFLTDRNLLHKIVRTIELSSSDSVLEIGPGDGMVTSLLLPIVKEMAAVEIDPKLVKLLLENSDLKKCHIIHKDVLWLELNSLPIKTPVKIVGNIPYNITSPILFWLIEQRQYWSETYLTLQKEVAERLAAAPGSKTYGRLTVMIQAFLDVELCFHIPPEAFYPQPKVTSSFIKLTRKSTSMISDEQFDRFEKVVAAAFSSRRKMLRNTLSGFNISNEVQKNIDFSRRPETLTLQEFVSLIEK